MPRAASIHGACAVGWPFCGGAPGAAPGCGEGGAELPGAWRAAAVRLRSAASASQSTESLVCRKTTVWDWAAAMLASMSASLWEK